MPLSNAIEAVVQDWLDGGAAPTTTYPSQWIGFAAGAAPTGAAPSECTDATYQRHLVTWAAGTGNTPRTRVDTTVFQVFDKAGATGAAAVQTMTGVLKFDAATGGTFLEFIPFGLPVTVPAGAPYTWGAASLTDQTT